MQPVRHTERLPEKSLLSLKEKQMTETEAHFIIGRETLAVNQFSKHSRKLGE